jgi:hypothetical protein
MLPGKKAPLTLNLTPNYQRELEYLYARRSAIDSVIASLEAYDRYRATTPTSGHGQRKSA